MTNRALFWLNNDTYTLHSALRRWGGWGVSGIKGLITPNDELLSLMMVFSSEEGVYTIC